MAVTLKHGRGDTEREGGYPETQTKISGLSRDDTDGAHRAKRYATFDRVKLPLRRIMYSSGMDISQSHRNACTHSNKSRWINESCDPTNAKTPNINITGDLEFVRQCRRQESEWCQGVGEKHGRGAVVCHVRRETRERRWLLDPTRVADYFIPSRRKLAIRN